MTKLLALSPVSGLMLMFGFMVVGWQLFNIFVGAVYYYLIVDVVPEPLLGRFYGLFRLFGLGAGMLFNYYIFGQAERYMTEIFVITSVVYGICILMMCWRVKEGEYPPPPKEEHGRWDSGIRNYAKECFGYRYYWWVFLVYGAFTWAGSAGMFGVFFYKDEIKLTLDQIGKLNTFSTIIVTLTTYPMGVLVDRWGSHKTLMTAFALRVVFSVASYFGIHGFWSALIYSQFVGVASFLVYSATMKWVADVYPRDRYGQFGSAGAMVGAAGASLLPYFAGLMIDLIKKLQPENCYRITLLWPAFFSILGFWAAFVVYQQWKKLGGPDNYNPP